MNPSDFAKINEIVGAALELDGEERTSFIERRCAGDEELLREVRELVEIDVGESFLAGSAQEASRAEVDLVGHRMGRLQIVEHIAGGGMSEIYRGVDELLERSVAVKVLKPGAWGGAGQGSAFLAEAKVLSALQHPNICAVHDFFQDAPVPGDEKRDVLVLELIDGPTLRERLDAGALDDPLEVAIQIARALTFAHERGVAHRDLKPENVMFTARNQLKVVDFGLARLNAMPEGRERESDPGTEPEKTTVAGTPGYIAPEQARGEPSTIASDLWSFGLMFIELLTGARPYERSASSAELIARARLGEARIPDGLRTHEASFVRRLLSPRAEDRPSARETLLELERMRQRPKRLRRIAIGVAALVICVFGITKYTLDLRAEREAAVAARTEAEGLVGFMLEDLAVSLNEVDRIDLIESVARRALEYYGDLGVEELGALRGRPVLALQTIGRVLDRQGDTEGAIETYRLAAEALQMARQENPSDDLLTYRLGMLYGKLGDTQQVAGRPDDAIRSLEQTIRLGEVLTDGFEPGDGPDVSPTAGQRWSLLLEAHYFLLDTILRQGRASEVVARLPPIIETAQQVMARSGAGAPFANLAYLDCAARLDSAGEGSVESCERTLAVDRATYEADPNNFHALGMYANGHIPLSDALVHAGDPDQALEAIDTGIELISRVLENSPEHTDYRNNRVAMLLVRSRALDALLRADERARTLENALVETSALIEQGDRTVVLNNHFATLVYLGRLEEARPFAEQLWQRGFRRPEFVKLCNQHHLCEGDGEQDHR